MTQARTSLLPPSYTPRRDEDAVLELLKDSAEQMRVTTAGVIEAEVEQLPGPGDNKLTLKYMLRVPALDDYRYNLFRLVKGLDDFPAELSDGGDRRVTLNTMADLESALRELFAGEATKAIIGRLLALAEEEDEP